MVRADAGRDDDFQFRRLGDPFLCKVSRPERLGDDDVRIRQFSFKNGVRAILVRGYDEYVALFLEKLTQSELTGDTPQKLPRREIYSLRSRHGLAIGITFQLGNIVTCVRLRVAPDGVVIKHTNNLSHFLSTY
jgi:hypothetical protein